MPRLAILALALGLLAGCTARAAPACLERCADLQIRDPKQCQTLCTTSCTDLQSTYGVSEDRCRELQAPAGPTTSPQPARDGPPTPASRPSTTSRRPPSAPRPP